MRPAVRPCPSKLAKVFALFAIVALLFSVLPVPAVQAAPDAPHATTTIAVLSDYGSGTALEQTVADMIASWNPVRIVTAGDNYHYQNCSSYATCVGNYYGSYVTAQTFMPSLGNHDYDSTVGLTAYNSYFTWLPTNADAQRRRYDFVAGDVHFFMIDGNRDRYMQAEWDNQTAWLQSTATASTSAWKIAVIHQAPYSTGYYGDIADSQLPYGQFDIDFVIAGHNHHFERLMKADGGKTVRYFIDGYGGTILSGDYGHSYCSYSTSEATSEFCLADTPGAIKLTASDTSITFDYYDSTGVVRNTYTEVIGPEITTSVSSLDSFSTTPGTPSAAQTYTVSGSLLSADISITAPAGFEIKTDAGTYGSTITLPQTGGVVSPTTISVRLTGAAEGNFAGNIAHTSSGAAQKDVAVSGIVGWCYDVSLVATADTRMRSSQASTNFGSEATVTQSPFNSYSQGGLYLWDVSGIDSGSTVSAASLSFYVTDSSAYAFSLYNLRRAWGENTATWNTYDGSNAWGTAGAANTSTDRYSTNLWDAGTSAFGASGSVTLDLNAGGVAVVQDWIDGDLPNYGMTIQGYNQASSADYWIVASSEATTESQRPKLNITYCASTSPTITTSGTLAPFSTTPGMPSVAQTYTVSGSNLTADISITAPDGFELSTDGSTYSSGLTLTQSGGAVGTTTIYVRLTGAEGTFSGNIAHTSAGAVTKNVAASGTASLCTTVSFQQGTGGYTGARDGHIMQNNPTYNYGATTPLLVDSDEPNGSGNDLSALLYWDLSAIPAGSTVESASVAVYVENVTQSPGFDMYAMTQAWTEGTGNGSTTANGATWNTYDGANAWPGGAGGASDRGSTVLANFTPTATGAYQAALNDAGEVALAGWINDAASNMGFMIHAGSTTNGLDFTSKEGTTVANRPQLTVAYCLAPTTPYIVTSGTLDPFSSTINVPSAEQSYTVSGGNLTGNIVITAPDGFQISTTPGGVFGGSVSLTPASGTVAPTPIYVRFLSSTLGTSTGDITHASADATTRNVAVSGTIINGAPAVSLVQPADDATGVALAPTLQATVTDPEAETMSVSFYGRPVSTAAPAEDFTLFVIPDTQSHVASSTLYVAFNAMTNYIVAQKDTRNVAFVTHVGDIVNTSSNTTEWQRADAAMDILDAGSVSYSVGPGNHDVAFGTTYYPDWFGNVRFVAQSTYQGYYTAEGDNYSNYSLFSASGMDFILINLKYQPSTGALDWADALLKTYSDRRGIVAQHDILNTNDTWANQATYTALSDNSNLFLIVCGHMHTSSDGSAYRLETRTGMNPVHVLLTDYQDYNNAANTGYLRILTFRPASDEIYAEVYSPYVSAYLTNASNYEQFTMAYDMEGTAEAPFELIGTVNGVASGANATVAWAGRDPNTEYEWYAVATDSASSAASAAWSFTTGAGGAAVPKAPVVTSIALSGSNDVTLAWNPVTQDVNGNDTTIMKYAVYGSQAPYFAPGMSDLLGEPTTTSFTHTGGSTGDTNWYYLVRAVNAVGESANSPRRTGRFGFILVPGTAGE